MKTLGLFEAKNRLSEVCEQVAATSEPVVITRHRKPLVQIVPIQDSEMKESVWDSVEESNARYGPLDEDFELPVRDLKLNREDPLS
jgi:prevent-host-death family protein